MANELNLLPASFRGVPFGVFDAGIEGGRRAVIHEFPQRDKPYTEDMGKKARSYTVEAYIVCSKQMDAANYLNRNSYQKYRDDLLTALEATGPGELVHPWYGKLMVQVLEFSIRESAKDGGMAFFSIKFTETQEVIYPEIEKSTIEVVSSVADITDVAAVETFEGNFFTELAGTIEEAEDKIRETLNLVENSFIAQIARDASNAFSAFVKAVSNTITEVSLLARQPLAFGYKMMGLMRTLMSSTTDAVAAVDSYKRFYKTYREFCDKTIAGYNQKTQFGAAAANNMQAMKELVSVACVTSAAIGAVSIQYGTQIRTITPAVQVAAGAEQENAELQPGQIYITAEDIQSAKDGVLSMIEELKDSVSDTVYETLLSLQQAIFEAPIPTPADIRFLKKIELQQEMNALVLAYRLYGSLENAEDIVCRNGICNPLLIPSGVELEVVTNE